MLIELIPGLLHLPDRRHEPRRQPSGKGALEFRFERNADRSVTFYTRGAARMDRILADKIGPIVQQQKWPPLVLCIAQKLELRGGRSRRRSARSSTTP